MKEGNRKALAISLVLIIAGLLVVSTWMNLVSFGAFPDRWVEEDYGSRISYRQALRDYGVDEDSIERILENKPEDFGNQSIGRDLLKMATKGTGASNAVTGILWDFRGYDTVGEATVIFVAVAGVAALFRSSKDKKEE